jgi:outer membrane biosynthesis protein TonB
MIKHSIAFIVILVLLVGGMSALVADEKPVALAAPQLQETSTPRPTPTTEPQLTDTPEPQPTNTSPPQPPTNTPVPPTNTPVPPTNTPVPPTRAPQPTSKPKQPQQPTKAPVPTEPPAPTAWLDRIPTTGFGSAGGWVLGATGLLLVCILIVARRLRMGKESGKEDNAASQSVNRRHPPQ